jgi:hypothetical protein
LNKRIYPVSVYSADLNATKYLDRQKYIVNF